MTNPDNYVVKLKHNDKITCPICKQITRAVRLDWRMRINVHGKTGVDNNTQVMEVCITSGDFIYSYRGMPGTEGWFNIVEETS